MKSKKYVFVVAGVVGVSALTLFLASGDAYARWQKGSGFQRSIERGTTDKKWQSNQREIIDRLCANHDYAGWKSLKGDAPITQYVNEGNFDKFCQMHDLRKEGKFSEADKIRQELGISWPRRSGKGGHCNR